MRRSSGQATIDMAVRTTRLGAADFLEKPLSTDKLLLTVDNVLQHVYGKLGLTGRAQLKPELDWADAPPNGF